MGSNVETQPVDIMAISPQLVPTPERTSPEVPADVRRQQYQNKPLEIEETSESGTVPGSTGPVPPLDNKVRNGGFVCLLFCVRQQRCKTNFGFLCALPSGGRYP